MNFKKNLAIYSTVIALAVFAVLGWSIALHKGGEANAESDKTTKVDSATLDALYQAAFHRSVDDEGRGFHLGRDLKDVLRDFNNSQEMRYYGALFKAVKSYEEDQRAPGTLSAEEKKSHLDLINSALGTLLAWVDTLPDRDACRASVGTAEARAAIQAAYDGMSPAAKLAAQKGIFNALEHIGRPDGIRIHPKCLRPTPTPSASVLVSPSVTPTPTPSATPTPTPSESQSPTPTPSS